MVHIKMQAGILESPDLIDFLKEIVYPLVIAEKQEKTAYKNVCFGGGQYEENDEYPAGVLPDSCLSGRMWKQQQRNRSNGGSINDPGIYCSQSQ